jgi:hypothetical protein
MKRIRTILAILFISLIPLSSAFGQEKKDKEKVKVVIADKSGTKVVIDTSFTWTSNTDSIITEGGNVIYIGKYDKEDPDTPGKQFKVIARVDKDGEDSEHQYVFINDGKVIRHAGDNSFHVMISDDEFDNDTEKTRIVIAKNGLTVSVEGTDEARVKELVKEIEKKLDASNEDPDKEPGVKEVEKEIIKKK